MRFIIIVKEMEAIWKMEASKIIAGVVRVVRDIEIAEDLAEDTLVIALERWTVSGIPDNPGAWLMTVAKRKAIDYLRRSKMKERKMEELGRELTIHHGPDIDAIHSSVEDNLLRLIFMTCHPVLSPEARVALTLRLLCGLTTDEIARAYLVSVSTVAQRIVRAKRTLSASCVAFEVPGKDELPARLSSVLEVIYLTFNEGYTATSGENWIRPILCIEALRLGRLLAKLSPAEPEVHGLVSLMELQASRFKARVSPTGQPVLLSDQNRALWDHLLIQRGLEALQRAEEMGCALGSYALQASIAACHARASSTEETDWMKISVLYETLFQVLPSPVVELNRAVSMSMVYGSELL